LAASWAGSGAPAERGHRPLDRQHRRRRDRQLLPAAPVEAAEGTQHRCTTFGHPTVDGELDEPEGLGGTELGRGEEGRHRARSAVGGVVAADHEVGAAEHAGQRRRHPLTREIGRRVETDDPMGTGRQGVAQHGVGTRRAERDHDHLRAPVGPIIE
jgi:hypothetical protein